LGDPLAYVRAVHFAATIVTAGTVMFQVIVAKSAFAAAQLHDRDIDRLRRRWTILASAGLAVAAVSGAIWLLLLAGEIYAAPLAEVWRDGGIWTVATATRFGQVSLARLAAAVLLAALLPALIRPTAAGPWRAGAVGLAIVVLIGPAWTGHAGAIPGEFPLAADALHLLAAGTWLGGLPPLAMLLAAASQQKEPRWAAATASALQRFSTLGMTSVGVLLASGIANSWYEVATLDNLFTTTYGQLVLVKIALFAAMVALASVNRFYLMPRLATSGAVRRLCQTSVAETTLGFAAIVVVGFLGAMAPASHTHRHDANSTVPEGAAFVHIHSNAGMADVTIMPGSVGTARLTVRLWNEEFQPLAAERLLMTLTPPGPAKPFTRAATKDQDGSWTVDAIKLPQPGKWTVAIDAALQSKGRLLLDAPIAIEPER
jgi:copper resistance protein D